MRVYKIYAHFTDGHVQVGQAPNYNAAHDVRRSFEKLYGLKLRTVEIDDKRGVKVWPRATRYNMD